MWALWCLFHFSTFLVLRGIIEPVAGNGFKGRGGDGQPAIEAQLDSPTGVAVDLFLGWEATWDRKDVIRWKENIRNIKCYHKDESTWKSEETDSDDNITELGTTKIDWSERLGLQNCLRFLGPKSSISLVLPLPSITNMLRNQMLWICCQAALDPERKKHLFACTHCGIVWLQSCFVDGGIVRDSCLRSDCCFNLSLWRAIRPLPIF